mmetsp:Transcript_18749/g.28528  ORF Transcript_18749/g.28528 Transcript_18749/m.28528 type:complete len:113 (+) Transcript_18749:28-366(+)
MLRLRTIFIRSYLSLFFSFFVLLSRCMLNERVGFVHPSKVVPLCYLTYKGPVKAVESRKKRGKKMQLFKTQEPLVAFVPHKSKLAKRKGAFHFDQGIRQLLQLLIPKPSRTI